MVHAILSFIRTADSSIRSRKKLPHCKATTTPPRTALSRRSKRFRHYPKNSPGTSFTSELRISHDGKFIYAANRLADSIATFSISQSGALTRVGETSTHGDYPRSFTLDPTGKFLVSCNQRSDALTTYRVDAKGSKLAFTGGYASVGSPSMLVFLPLEASLNWRNT